MKTQPFLFVFALLAFAPSAQADAPIDVQTPPVTVTYRFNRAHGDTRVITEQFALEQLALRLGRQMNDSDGWSGVGKARIKLPACPTGLTFKGIPSIGLDWKRTNTGNPELYTGTITRMRCG